MWVGDYQLLIMHVALSFKIQDGSRPAHRFRVIPQWYGDQFTKRKHDQLRSTSVRSAVIPSNFIFFDDASKKDVKN